MLRKNSPVTRPGIDPGTFRLVAQRLNHYATPGTYALQSHCLSRNGLTPPCLYSCLPDGLYGYDKWFLIRMEAYTHSTAKTSPYGYLTYHVDVCVHAGWVCSVTRHAKCTYKFWQRCHITSELRSRHVAWHSLHMRSTRKAGMCGYVCAVTCLLFCGLRIFKNRIFLEVFGPKREEVDRRLK